MRTTLQSLAFIQKETAVLLCRKDVNKTRPLKPSQEHKNDAGDEHNERGADDEDYEHRDDPTVEQIEQPEYEITEEADAAHNVREPSDNDNVRLRRSARQRKQPKWMNEGEFIVNMVCRAMMNDVLDKSVVLNLLFGLMSELHLLLYNDGTSFLMEEAQ